jgi:hypothetical protein
VKQEDDISALWTEAVGKPIKSASSDDAGLDNLEEHFRAVLDPAWARDLRLVNFYLHEILILTDIYRCTKASEHMGLVRMRPSTLSRFLSWDENRAHTKNL